MSGGDLDEWMKRYRENRERLDAKGLIKEAAEKPTITWAPRPPEGASMTGDTFINTDTGKVWVSDRGGGWREAGMRAVATNSAAIENSIRKVNEGLTEAFEKMAREMAGMGEAMTRAMTEMMKVATAPHVGGWVDSVGWICERCGAESMDLELFREVPCG